MKEFDLDNEKDGPNGSLASFSPILSAAVQCNTSIDALGNTAQAKSALFYILKYVTKNSLPLSNVLSLYISVKEQILARPSIAEDTGTDIRTGMHHIQRLINSINGSVEVAAQVAGSCLMGLTGEIFSHDFWYVYNYQALRYLKEMKEEFFDSISDQGNILDNFYF